MEAWGLEEKLLRDRNGSSSCSNLDPDSFKQFRASLAQIANVWRSKSQPKRPLWPHERYANDTRAPWRNQLGEALESTVTHIIIVALLLIDLLATAIDILKTVHNKSHDLGDCVNLLESCQCTSHFESSEPWEFLHWVSIAILCVLVLNVFGLLIAFGSSFFRNPGYVLDLVVVVTALCLELFLDSETAGLLVILNLWRIIRVAHGIFEVTDEAWEKEIHKLETQVQAIEAAHNQDLNLLRRKDERITELELQLNPARKGASFDTGSDADC